MKPIRITKHASENLEFYSLDATWVEQAVRGPDWTSADPEPPKQRRYRTVPELAGRVLRVVCVEEADHSRIVTVFPDRDARRPDAP